MPCETVHAVTGTAPHRAQPSQERRRRRPAPDKADDDARPLPGPLVFLVLCAGYLASSQFTFVLQDPATSGGAALWPAAGLTLGALLVLPVRRWVWVLGAVAAAELGGDLVRGLPLVPSLGWTLANTLEPVVGAVLFRRFAGGDPALTPVRRLLLFLAFPVVLAPAVAATIGTPATVAALGLTWEQVWPRFAVGDALGVLIVAPLVLTARTLRSVRPTVEGLVLTAAVSVTVVAVFASAGDTWLSHATFALVPFFLWAGLRFGVRGSAWLSFGVTLVANTFTTLGRGPFAGGAAAGGHADTMLQLFFGVTVGTGLLIAALTSDLTDRHELEAVLRRRAVSDTLTGLPNRLALGDALDRALHTGAGDPARVALLVCDIDHLKMVNDTMGHAAGDALILEVARRMEGSVREGDVVARIGGDEFVVVLHDVTEDDALALARRTVAAVTAPLVLGSHHRATPSLSVGLAMGEAGVSGESVFNAADAALYAAKRTGRGQIVAFDEQLRRDAQDRLEIERDVAGAIEAGRITCAHQPQVDLATGSVVGLETLARWDHPQRGTIPPDRFVPAAERTGQAGPLFASMLRQSLAAQAAWATDLGVHLPVAVNLSPLQLRDPDLTASVARALSDAGASPEGLWLELTETALAEPSALRVLGELHDLGVGLALDDFGTGWSSMSRLAQVPCDLLKLDKSFVAGLGVQESADHLVRAVIVMAHALGIRTVAEGVETQEQLDRLVDLGCDIVQGFLLSRPVPTDRVVGLVAPGGVWAGDGVVARR